MRAMITLVCVCVQTVQRRPAVTAICCILVWPVRYTMHSQLSLLILRTLLMILEYRNYDYLVLACNKLGSQQTYCVSDVALIHLGDYFVFSQTLHHCVVEFYQHQKIVKQKFHLITILGKCVLYVRFLTLRNSTTILHNTRKHNLCLS